MCSAMLPESPPNSKTESSKICCRSKVSGNNSVTVWSMTIGSSAPGGIGKITAYDRIEKAAAAEQDPKRQIKIDGELPILCSPADVLKIGEKVTVKITDIDEERKRVSLSIRALLPVEEAAEEAPAEEAEAPVEE